MGDVYLLKCGSIYKIGRANRFKNRWKQYQSHSPFKLEILFWTRVKDPDAIEQYFLRLYARKIVPGKKEWMRLTPRHVWRIRKHFLSLKQDV